MLKDFAIGQYFHAQSLVHKLDPRIKILAVFLYMTGLFIIDSPMGYAVYVLFTVITIISSNIPFKVIFRSLKPLWLIILMTMFMHIFFTPGEVIWQAAFIKVTAEGLRSALLMSVRLTLLIVFASLLTLTTTPINLTDGMEKILKPFTRFGVPAHELAMMMTIALRFIPTLAEELDKIIKAQTARGADFEEKNLVKKVKSLIPLLVPLFISAFRRADELALAMEARCYRGGDNRTRMYELKLQRCDYITLPCIIIFFLITIILHYKVNL